MTEKKVTKSGKKAAKLEDINYKPEPLPMKVKKEKKKEENVSLDEGSVSKKDGEEIRDLDEKKKLLLEKAKKLSEKVIETSSEEIVEKVKEKEGTELLPLEEYVKSGIYLGTRVITPDMRKYVYRRRNDGIAVFNTTLIDKKLKEAAELLAQYDPKDFIIVCKRPAGETAVKMFSQLTGVRIFVKKYPAGILTNTSLPDFFETKLVVICDPWVDKNAMKDAQIVHIPILALCDTNNLTKDLDYVLPSNNKSNKSLGLVFYVLAREYMKARGIKGKLPDIEKFKGEEIKQSVKYGV